MSRIPTTATLAVPLGSRRSVVVVSSLFSPSTVNSSSSLSVNYRNRIHYSSSGSLTSTSILLNTVHNSSLPVNHRLSKPFSSTSTITHNSTSRTEWLRHLQFAENRLKQINNEKVANIQDLVNVWADIRTLCDQFGYYCSIDIEQIGTSSSSLPPPPPSTNLFSTSISSPPSSSTSSSPPSIASLHARLHLLFLNLFDTVWTAGVHLYGNLLDDKEENLLSYIVSSRHGLPPSTSINHMYSIELHSCCKEIMRNALRYGCTPDIRIFDKYIRLLGMRSSTIPRELFNIIQFFGLRPNSSTYRSLLLVAARHHTPVDTLPVLIAMREYKYRPDAFILSAILGDIDKLLYGGNTSNNHNEAIGNSTEEPGMDDGRLRLVIDVALAGAEEEVAEAVDELQAAQARVNEGIAALEAVEANNENNEPEYRNTNNDDDYSNNKYPSIGSNRYGPGLRRRDDHEEDDDDSSDEAKRIENYPKKRSEHRSSSSSLSKFPLPNLSVSEMQALTEVLESFQRSQDSKDAYTTEDGKSYNDALSGTDRTVEGTVIDKSFNSEQKNNYATPVAGNPNPNEAEDEDETNEESDTLDPVPPSLAYDAERWRKLAEQVLRENNNSEGLSPLEFQQKILSLRSTNSGKTDGHLTSADLLPSAETQALIEKEAMRVLEESKQYNDRFMEQKKSVPSSSGSDGSISNSASNLPPIVGSLSGNEWKTLVAAYREACTTVSQRRYDYLMEYVNTLLDSSSNKSNRISKLAIDPRLMNAIQSLSSVHKQEVLQLLRKRLQAGLYLPANITLLSPDNPDYLHSLAKHTIQNLSSSSSNSGSTDAVNVVGSSSSDSSSLLGTKSTDESIRKISPIIHNQLLSSLLYACLVSESSKRQGEEIFK